MKFDNVVTVKKEITKEAFLRQALICLGTDSRTSAEVMNASFGEVRERTREVILCSAQVEGVCTASVGYDRDEVYTEYENYQEKVGDQYVTRQRPVTRHRTVTDWRPFSTNFSGEGACAVCNEGYSGEIQQAEVAVSTLDPDSCVEKGDADINQAALELALSVCKSRVASKQVSFPGDRHRDKHIASEATVTSIQCMILPFYELTYVYHGKEYHVSAFACGNLNVSYEVPPQETDIDTMVRAGTEKGKKQNAISWGVFFGMLGLSVLLGIVAQFWWFWPLTLASLGFAIYSGKKYIKDYANQATSLKQQVSDAKINALNAALTRYHLERYGETPRFDGGPATVQLTEKMKGQKQKIIIGACLSALLVLVSICAAPAARQKKLHSVKQVQAAIVDISPGYEEGDCFSNDSYCLKVDYCIQTKRIGIDSIHINAHFQDKKGREIGTLETSLDGLNMDAHDRQMITSYWTESQPERNEFFTKVYEKGFSKFRVSYEIESITFSDGYHYYNIG